MKIENAIISYVRIFASSGIARRTISSMGPARRKRRLNETAARLPNTAGPSAVTGVYSAARECRPHAAPEAKENMIRATNRRGARIQSLEQYHASSVAGNDDVEHINYSRRSARTVVRLPATRRARQRCTRVTCNYGASTRSSSSVINTATAVTSRFLVLSCVPLILRAAPGSSGRTSARIRRHHHRLLRPGYGCE